MVERDTSQHRGADGRPLAKGRGAGIDPPNRFASEVHVPDWSHWDDAQELPPGQTTRTEFLPDRSRSIVTENNSPDIPFRYSVNPYRGCEHGCAYCYARPTHEYLGLNAGSDFESKVFVKHDAPQLLREWLSRPRYVPEHISFSGVTDCYQPAERHFQLTRRCLQVALEFRQPVSIVTKNALVTRDLDILAPLAEQGLAHVALSITTLDSELARTLEPRTSSPSARLRAIRELTDAGVRVFVMTAPVIPGLNDSEIPALLQAAAEHGAQGAGYVMLRLPLAVKPVFLDWVERQAPHKRAGLETLVRQVRDGNLYEAEFGTRMRGVGQRAEQIAQTFRVFAARHGLNQKWPALRTDLFQVPPPTSGQLTLF